MKKKATLLIRHLSRIYPMIPSFSAYIDAGFIAIHHERILAVGEGDGAVYVDKDTRILEGWGQICVPAFIDVACAPEDAWMPMCNYERGTQLVKRGTLIINQEGKQEKTTPVSTHLLMPRQLQIPLKAGYTLIKGIDVHAKAGKRVCISTGFPQSECLDQLLCAKLYAKVHPNVAAHDILAACTILPARCLSLYDVGFLKAGAHANLLLFKGKSFADVLNRFYAEESIQVIKEGVRIYPKLIV